MKKLLVALLLISNIVNSQNLILNGSFELNDSIPDATGEINCVNNWRSSGGSPDYFHESATVISDVNIPYTFLGTVDAGYEGQAFVGICNYMENWDNYREYLYQRIIPALQSGNYYKVKMSILTEKDPCTYGAWTSDNFAVAFSMKKLHKGANGVINYIPQCTYPTQLYADEWTDIEFVFYADSNYKYMTIGCFVDDSTQQRHKTDSSLLYNCVYVFIDNVSLMQLSLTGIYPLYMGDTITPVYINIYGQIIDRQEGFMIIKRGNKYEKVYIK